MGRKRKHNTDLPKHWTIKHGTIYYIVQAKYQHLFDRKWEPLGKTRIDAHRKFANLPIHEEVNIRSIRTIEDLADLYEQEIYPLNSAMTRENKQNYMKAVRVGVGKIPIEMIEEHHARTLFKKMSKLRGVKTGKEIVGLLRHMISVAKEHGIVKENPLLGMRIKGNAPRRRLVEYAELEKFIDGYAGPLLSVYIPLKLITGMDKQMMLASAVRHIRDDGLHTVRRKNASLPKVYLWDDDIDEEGNLVEAGQLRRAIDAILAYKKKQGQPSIYLFCNRLGQPYLPLENGRMFDEAGHAFGKPEGFNSIWQRRMSKWVADGNERFTEHDIRKVPASATNTEHAQQLLDHHSGKITKQVYQVGKKVVEIQRTPGAK